MTATAGSSQRSTRSIVRVVLASLMGTTVEWYDFFLYGTAATLVFPKVFFPNAHDPLQGALLAFATYFVGFFFRPLGGLVFGHFGDTIGRKKLLVIALISMGVATFTIGLLPTYAQVGVLAPVLLTLLRCIQGFALGGEWGGAILIVSEHGDAARRGFWGSWPQVGSPAGQLLAAGVMLLMSAVQSEAEFLSWGWRVPFLLSAILVGVGLWIRVRIEESPVFREAQAAAAARQQARPVPLRDLFRRYPREIVTAIGARIAENAGYGVFTVVIVTYVTTVLEMPRAFALNAILIASVVDLIVLPLWGALSDKVGRKPIFVLGALGVGVWAFPFIALLNQKSFPLAVLAVSIALVFHAAMYGPMAAFFSELFGTGVRYSGVSVGFQLSGIIASGVAPMISVWLLTTFGTGYAISGYVLVCGLISALSVLTYRETKERDLRTVTRGETGGLDRAEGPRA